MPPPGSPIASGIWQPTARSRSCLPNARTRSSCKRPWATPAGIGFGGVAGEPRHTRVLTPSSSSTPKTWPRSGAGGSCRAGSSSWPEATCCTSRLRDRGAYLDAIGRTFPIEPKTRGSTTDRADEEDNTPLRWRPRVPRQLRLARGPIAPAGASSARGDWCRISLGVESGDPEVRSIYHKSWADDELRATVADIKAAGLGVSVLTLVGAGGVERAEPHVERTARLIESLDLGAGRFRVPARRE